MSRAKSVPVRIVVDVHERQSGIAETLAELGAEVEIASLPAGDYAVGANTLVRNGSPCPASAPSEPAHSRRHLPSGGARSRPAETTDRPPGCTPRHRLFGQHGNTQLGSRLSVR